MLADPKQKKMRDIYRVDIKTEHSSPYFSADKKKSVYTIDCQ